MSPHMMKKELFSGAKGPRPVPSPDHYSLLTRNSRLRTVAAVAGFFVAGFVPFNSMAAGPFEEYQGLVAGQGPAGYRDGAFNRALFRQPMGLALSEDRSTLYVADQGNHLIRAVSLLKNNEVSTFAGTGKPGKEDGPLSIASFNHPGALAFLSGGRLAVLDRDNSLIRVIDLQSKSVSVLAGNGTAGSQDGPATQASISEVWTMAYDPQNQFLYFSQPNGGLLRRVRLAEGKVETVLSADPRIPRPGALCLLGSDLYVANEGVTGTVVCLKPNPTAPKDAKPADRFTVETVVQGRYITALAGCDDYLYALQADSRDDPLLEVLPKALAGPVSLRSWWGEPFSKDGVHCLLFDNNNAPLGFVADPLSKRRFLLSNPNTNFIGSVRDLGQGQYSWDDMYNLGGLAELQYPSVKPPHTYRILVVGRSYVYFVYNRAAKSFSQNHAENLSKRLELFLNLSASMDEQPLRYEVLSCGKIMDQSICLWAREVVPPLVKKYDIDLVLVCMDPGGTSVLDYYQRPYGPDGLPVYKFDDEYVLKPFAQRIQPGLPQKLYELCQKYKVVEPVPDSKLKMNFHGFGELVQQPEIRDCLVEMVGKPLDELHQRLKAINLSTGGNPKLELAYLPGVEVWSDSCCHDDFWQELAKKWGLDLMDLSSAFDAQRMALFPFDGENHLDTNGLIWMGDVLAHELTRQQVIPWTSPNPVKNTK